MLAFCYGMLLFTKQQSTIFHQQQQQSHNNILYGKDSFKYITKSRRYVCYLFLFSSKIKYAQHKHNTASTNMFFFEPNRKKLILIVIIEMIT